MSSLVIKHFPEDAQLRIKLCPTTDWKTLRSTSYMKLDGQDRQTPGLSKPNDFNEIQMFNLIVLLCI